MGIMKTTEGEIVRVEGGHIVRSTGRKDRHSKVYTAKGPRDRRVRLSAHTAIQFYDVQDRLGYDRPSKAVDWLMKKAKSAIDKLAELPPWNPLSEQTAGSAGETQIADSSSGYIFQLQQNNHPSIDDFDTMKSFFPTSSTTSSINFQSYPSEDLGLSLHTFQDHQGFLNTASRNGQSLFTGSSPLSYDANYYQRLVDWSNESSCNGGGGFIFSTPSSSSSSLLGQQSNSAFSSQRGTLQSSFSPPPPCSVRLWSDTPIASSDNSHHNAAQPDNHHQQQLSIFGSRFLSDGFPGFCLPTTSRALEEEEGHHGNSHH